jgi:predicted Zn-dependent protease with MMP-like domain
MRKTARDFEALVEQALAQLPACYRARLRNLLFVVEDEPREAGLLGLYEGRPLTERIGGEPAMLPDRITIYQRPHERACRSERELRAMVAETVWHEVGHYFGMDERQTLRAERRRARRPRL